MSKERKVKISAINLVFVVAVVFLLGMMTGTYVYQKRFSVIESNNNAEATHEINGKVIEGEHVTQTALPAVDSEGTGVVGMLMTRVRPGSGLVLVNVNDVLAQADTQLSGRIAAQVAGKYMNISMKDYDVIYSIDVNATVVEGPSAGAAMAVSIIGALQNKTLNSSVMITGTIEEDGRIGSVGAIFEKARAAQEAGATLYLVPSGQGVQNEMKRERKCTEKTLPNLKYEECEIKYIPQKINIGSLLGIDVVEVKTINDVMRYFI